MAQFVTSSRAEKIWKIPFFESVAKKPEEPIRAELFSIERLEQHGESLASSHSITHKQPWGRTILGRVKENGRILSGAYRHITQTIREDRTITPAAEWLADNFHIVEEQILEIIDDLPPAFYRKLPKLTEGFLKGYPRVYGVAWALVAHTDSRFDPDWLRRFVRAYQRINPLLIGEIWALTISLRIILVENLRRLVEQLALSRTGQLKADHLADSLLGLRGLTPAAAEKTLRSFGSRPLEKSFAVQLVLRLRDQGENVAPVLQWLEECLESQGTSAEHLVRQEHQEQTAMNTSVRNVITSMRLISALDWTRFFEDVSVADEILRASSRFETMDFATRDLYRHAIEELALGSGLSEIDVTKQAILAAENAQAVIRKPKTPASVIEIERESDPGYYLISKGRLEFEKQIRCRVSLQRRFFRFYVARATEAYLGTVTLTAAGLLSIPLYYSCLHGMSLTAFIAFAVAGFFPASDLAVALVNQFVTKTMGPRSLPKLDFSKGIPAPFRTLVVIPTMLSSPHAIQENMDRLEIHYLSNPEGYLQFALLTDWTDAPEEHLSEDTALLAAATEGIRKLNDRYGPGPGKSLRFFLFHRRRLWNAADGVWMGWERKRGKLHELNRLLRGDAQTSFLLNSSELAAVPKKICYVITLDADTRMSYGTAYRLAGAMAHPLNRPFIDPESRRVTAGYGIMQPRITPTLPITGEGSLYQWIFSGPIGIDPYAFAVSDVYQDLFQEGSYIGKGIYDLDAFEASLAGRVPENRILSHDLFEGLHARAALATDIELFEEFPSHYEVAVSRTHRWVRGDWQLLPWIAGRPSAAGGHKSKALPFIGRWKMADNLRRSLSAPALLLTLFFAWSFRSAPAAVWMLFILAVIALAPLQPFWGQLMARHKQIPLRRHLRAAAGDFYLALSHIFLTGVFLVHQASLMTDAIARTIYRLFISRRKMLEWTSDAQSQVHADYNLSGFYKRMAAAPLVAVMAPLLLLTFHTSNRLWMMLPFAVLWALSPWIARQISLPIRDAGRGAEALSPTARQSLRLIARKTWQFFETFVDESHHFLPPDNFQEVPEPVTAHRTSPTNIGLYLLSVSAARDFGWIGLSETVERLENSLKTLKELKKYRGHLYNWYDTHTLEPLNPLYVSSVDSGNLAGHLWTLAGTCRQLGQTPLMTNNILSGLADIFTFIQEDASNIRGTQRTETVTQVQLEETLAAIRLCLRGVPESHAQWSAHFSELKKESDTLSDIARALDDGALLKSSDRFARQIHSHAKDFEELIPDQGKPECLTLAEIPALAASALHHLASDPQAAFSIPLIKQKERLEVFLKKANALLSRFSALEHSCEQLVNSMEFGFLFDPVKKIFSIGFQVMEHKLDSGYYDLLTSEARLASFVAIAKGDIPVLHWFRLARSLISLNHKLALVSWSGSMFEYLMPFLVMQSPSGSLLDQTCRRVVQRQIDYGAERAVPWGISESAYNVQNLQHSYQYSNFGVPGLGLKRGLSEDLVIAPYATALAAMINPAAAIQNFRHLAQLNAEGYYGFYESLDFTPERLPEKQKVVVVRAYMAHHQGMILVSLANVLHEGIFRTRFHGEPMVQACDLLLQERTPRAVTVVRVRPNEVPREVRQPVPLVLRRFDSPHEAVPRTQLLSNGRYSVMITTAGSGASRWRDIALTRWREDTTRDASGTYIFLRDVESGAVWSAGYQPTGLEPATYQADFSEDRAEIIRKDGALETTLEVIVSPEDDAELRRVTLKNTGTYTRLIDVTSYAEIVLAPQAADLAHPAFSNLFIHTEFIPEVNGLICHRRARAPDDLIPWAGHVLVVEGKTIGAVQYESNRTRFVGRGRSLRNPVSVLDGKPLSDNAGAVLDPIVSLRCRVPVPPGETVHMTFTTLVSASREETMALADKYHDPAMFERALTLAWTHAHIQQHHLAMEPSEAHLFQNLASRIFYAHNGMRPSPDILKLNTRGPSALWTHGISGDLPIVLVRLNEEDVSGIVRDILRAHEYWRMKNLPVDLVIVNERGPTYSQDLQGMLENLVRGTQTSHRHEATGAQGHISILRLGALSSEEFIALQSAARIILKSRDGSIAQQAERLETLEVFSPPSRRKSAPAQITKRPAEPSPLQFFNGLGGFSADGREYSIHLGPGQWTPAPWINVIANPHFGFQVSESGSGYTWAENCRENQLTPWSNDPVTDPSGEIFYLRDEETGEVWTPTPLPIRKDAGSYVSRHGHGYSQFEHSSHGIALRLLQYVPVKDPVKISRLRITNQSGRTRLLSLTAYVEWVLGTSRDSCAPFIITRIDEKTGAMLAANPWNSEFAGRTAFADLSGLQTAWTADRTEFLGRNGTYDLPAALFKDGELSGHCGPGLDPCAALQKSISLRAGESLELVFLLGQGENSEAARSLIRHYRNADLDAVLSAVKKQWDDVLGAVQVRTPDKAMDLLLNHWLLYQTLACRIWARSGFYQSGGAYGFRDQLQDVMALTVSRRDLARAHILRAAARQFPEGDVQHWWHPPSGRGVRTKISDDLVWLPYTVTHYLTVTGDFSILDESIPFLESQPIPPGKEDAYFEPKVSGESATLFEHCARALNRSLRVGSHGLPLMGSGDWNDGMNLIGREGKGESVWLAWFLHSALWEFAKIAEIRGESAHAEKWRLHVGDLKAALEHHGWDGKWYRRAYFDDGTPLGSAENPECRIDSIAQSWGVLSGAADPARAARSMAALKENLVREKEGLILLLTPPFDKMKPSPGYIQGYLPGIRENGGQYTHAGVWAVLAFAALGDGNTAEKLFSLLNPIHHGSTRADIQRYKVEPYVMAGDVYAGTEHSGRGGWSWYTGSAGWMYRAGMEWLLGFRLQEKVLFMDPCIPEAWPGFEISFTYHSSHYEVQVENPQHVSQGLQSIEMDGKPLSRTEGIALADDGAKHRIRIVLGMNNGFV
ncbi:MAG: glucoamylase family protein [Candidatus Omnitrophota bacterium]|nr:glucoamylase family protein [Candidatus Omnitrophota bacterium]